MDSYHKRTRKKPTRLQHYLRKKTTFDRCWSATSANERQAKISEPNFHLIQFDEAGAKINVTRCKSTVDKYHVDAVDMLTENLLNILWSTAFIAWMHHTRSHNVYLPAALYKNHFVYTHICLSTVFFPLFRFWWSDEAKACEQIESSVTFWILKRCI